MVPFLWPVYDLLYSAQSNISLSGIDLTDKVARQIRRLMPARGLRSADNALGLAELADSFTSSAPVFQCLACSPIIPEQANINRDEDQRSGGWTDQMTVDLSNMNARIALSRPAKLNAVSDEAGRGLMGGFRSLCAGSPAHVAICAARAGFFVVARMFASGDCAHMGTSRDLAARQVMARMLAMLFQSVNCQRWCGAAFGCVRGLGMVLDRDPIVAESGSSR